MTKILPFLRRVALVVPPSGQLIGVLGVAEAFDAANRLRAYTGKAPLYAMQWFSTSSTVPTVSGLSLVTTPLRELGAVHTLVVGGAMSADQPLTDASVVQAIRRVAADCERVVAVCAGTFSVAEAGLLDGKQATTHWLATDALRQQVPSAAVAPDALFTQDGGVFCSAGATAGIDLALHLIRLDAGPTLARAVARSLVVFAQRPGGQSQFAAANPPPTATDDRIRAAMARVVADPGADHRVPTLARGAGMSPRTFARRFKDQVRTTPAAFVQRMRVQAAQRLLEHADQPVAAIADDVGFGGADALRRAFLRQTGVTPSAYRERFALK